MRLTEFTELMTTEFGVPSADSILSDHILIEVGGRTGAQAIDDGVDPRDVWYDANLNQDIAFDKNMDVFFDWVAGNDATYHLGTSGKAIKK